MSIQKFEFFLLCVLMICLLLTLFLILNNTYNLRLINSKYKNKFDMYETINYKKNNIIESQNTLHLNLINLLENHKKKINHTYQGRCKKDFSNIFEKRIIPSVKKLLNHEKHTEEENSYDNISHYDYDDYARWSYI